MATFLDTHAAIYLAEGRVERFGTRSRAFLEEDDLLVSPFVRLELTYLRECRKIACEPDEVIGLLAALRVSLSTESVQEVVGAAMSLGWTRDPFDRLITATAALTGSPLVTRDGDITANYSHAVW